MHAMQGSLVLYIWHPKEYARVNLRTGHSAKHQNAMPAIPVTAKTCMVPGSVRVSAAMRAANNTNLAGPLVTLPDHSEYCTAEHTALLGFKARHPLSCCLAMFGCKQQPRHPQHTWLVSCWGSGFVAPNQTTLLGPLAKAVVALWAFADVLSLPIGSIITADLAREQLLLRV